MLGARNRPCFFQSLLHGLLQISSSSRSVWAALRGEQTRLCPSVIASPNRSRAVGIASHQAMYALPPPPQSSHYVLRGSWEKRRLFPREMPFSCLVLFYFAALVLAKAAEPAEGGWENVSFCIPNSLAAPQPHSKPLPVINPELLYTHFHPNQ